ncbi:MAG: DNA cytosine methyltransferase [bacterium]|nr:DNA cytosine methyltransferase [bacterium]
MRKTESAIPILSLFSGGGFLDMGFMLQGFQVKEAIEINPPFIEAYNYGLSHFLKNHENHYFQNGVVTHNEITKPVDASEKKEQLRLARTYKNISGIIGGPPCQDYSVGGKNRGLEGKRGKLILSYLAIVNRVKPDFILFENVVGLYKTKWHRATFQSFVADIEAAGYNVWVDVLNPLEYGVPQDRGRVVLVGFRKKIVSRLQKEGFKLQKDGKVLKHSDDTGYVFKWPKVLFKDPKSIEWPFVWEFGSEVIKDEVDKIPADYSPLLVSTAFAGLNSAVPNQEEHFNPYSYKFKVVKEGETQRKSFKRLHRYRYSPTVAYGNNEVHLHPTEPRRLSVRESLRLQSVPDSYVLPESVNLSQKFKLISNGVPTGKAELVAMEIKRTLTNYSRLTN